MAVYRALTDLITNWGYVPAGTTFTDGASVVAGVPQLASPSYTPPPCLDCLDLDACRKMFAQGPAQPQIAPFQPPPAVYWQAVAPPGRPGVGQWQLTGLGAGLGVADWVATRGIRS
jgi:hypothetical protein